MPNGIDVFWTDFQFGSGGATKALQKAIGLQADGIVGMQTLGTLRIEPDKTRLLDTLLVARLAYYDACGFRTRWPGLYRRARVGHDLAQTIAAASAPKPALVTVPKGLT